MARIVVHSMAYRGDVFPYVPIANELEDRGHDVTFVVPREFHPLFAEERFECRHSGTDFGPRELDRHGDYVARWGRRLHGAMLMRLYFGKFMIPHLPELHSAVDEALAGADLLVAHPAASLVSRIAAERRRIPWVVGDLFPDLTPTSEAVPPGFPLPRVRGPVTQHLTNAAWALPRRAPMRWMMYEPQLARFRAEQGLATERGDAFFGRLSPHLNVLLVSPHYFPPRSDWPDNYRVVGFTSWGSGDDALPDEVERYVDAGDPPVLVTLGTSAASAAPHVFHRVAGALDDAGLRGVFCVSNAANAAVLGADGVWPFVPFAPLLPRCRAVVHSGAHGTNALVLQAGLPSVVVPHVFDQVWHARRQVELGAGIHVRRPTRRRLASALDRVVHEPDHVARAKSVAATMRDEDGTTAAADEIERFLAA